MNKIVCSVCSTENEEEYKYCKNCGNALTLEKTDEGGKTDNLK